MPGNPFHIRICAQDVANVHYVFNDKSPWEAKHCSMSFIASQFDQGIPKFALPRGNIQNCKAHLPLKRLNITSHSKIIQNHTSHQHTVHMYQHTWFATQVSQLDESSTAHFVRNWGIGPHNDIPQRHTRRGHSHCLPEGLAMAATWGCLVAWFICIRCKKQIKEQHCFPDLSCIFCIMPYTTRLSNKLDLSYKAMHECEG